MGMRLKDPDKKATQPLPWMYDYLYEDLKRASVIVYSTTLRGGNIRELRVSEDKKVKVELERIILSGGRHRCFAVVRYYDRPHLYVIAPRTWWPTGKCPVCRVRGWPLDAQLG